MLRPTVLKIVSAALGSEERLSREMAVPCACKPRCFKSCSKTCKWHLPTALCHELLRRLCFVHRASLCSFPALSLCCFPAQTHRAGQAGWHAASPLSPTALFHAYRRMEENKESASTNYIRLERKRQSRLVTNTNTPNQPEGFHFTGTFQHALHTHNIYLPPMTVRMHYACKPLHRHQRRRTQ